MYIPTPNAVADETVIRDMVAAAASAQFVTTGADGYPVATLLPIIWIGDTVIAHMAKANPQWRNIDGHTRALLICSGPQAYISPSWYAAKAEHGRVVPTWNYSAVHLSGSVRVHQDPQWLRTAVEDLTARPRGSPSPTVAGDRRSGRLHQRPTRRHRRPGDRSGARGGQGQTQPEQVRGRPAWCHRRSARREPARSGRRGSRDAPLARNALIGQLILAVR